MFNGIQHRISLLQYLDMCTQENVIFVPFGNQLSYAYTKINQSRDTGKKNTLTIVD
jgi:hypothetical protein